MAEKEPKTSKDANPKPADGKVAPPKLKPVPNNPDEASTFVFKIKKATDQFAQTIHSYEPYKIQDVHSDYVLRYYELLVQVEDYFVDTSTEAVLELVDDTTCKCMRMETEREWENQVLCKDPQVSSGTIPQPHTIMNKLEALPDFKKFEGGEQFAIVELFRNLQKAHNASTETASHLAFLARTLKPDQFSIILKHSICPLIQLEIPARLCNLGELKFAKKDLSPDEAFEQHAVKIILPCPTTPTWKKLNRSTQPDVWPQLYITH